MPHLILFDDEVRDHLLPLTYTRPVCELRVGILTIREKWERWMGGEIAFVTQDYLAEKYPIDYGAENIVINGSVLPSEQLCTLLKQMEFNEAFLRGDELIAAKLDEAQFERLVNDEEIKELRGFDLEDTQYLKLDRLWDIFQLNDQALELDFQLLTQGRTSQPLSSTNTVIGPSEKVFLEEGAEVECAMLNTARGPIYLGANAQIMEGSTVRGGLAMGPHSVLKMGAKIYGATTLGPHCKLGGEVNNSVLQGYSNKGHDGYLGNSVIGEWCNLGADTNASNLRNNYGEIKAWSYVDEDFRKTGRQFAGLFMGDHSKSGINTMFNTGTVVGVSANVFGSGFPPKFIPSFSWGGAGKLETFLAEKAFEAAEYMMSRRKVAFDLQERLIMLRIFEESARYRYWEMEQVE